MFSFLSPIAIMRRITGRDFIIIIKQLFKMDTLYK
jgi:hypothetical protein